MTRNREYASWRGYVCPGCGNSEIVVIGAIPKFCDACGADLTNKDGSK